LAQALPKCGRERPVALEQEMLARVSGDALRGWWRLKAQIPLAMSESFRAGHLGIMDYNRMREYSSRHRHAPKASAVGGSQGNHPG